MCVVKEIYRAKKVVGGIADASKVLHIKGLLNKLFYAGMENEDIYLIFP